MKNTLAKLSAALFLAALALPLTAQELIPAKPQIQQDAEQLTEGIVNVAEALNHTATILQIEHDRFWSLPDARLLAVLNADVPRMLAISAAKDAAAVQINALLNQLNLAKYAKRAPTGLGRADVIFNAQSNLFEIVPPEEEETPPPAP